MMMLYITLCVTVLCATISAAPTDKRKECPPSHEWNILKLTQSWPPAVCIYLENERRNCSISSNIKSWVIHGLWPTETGTECPNYCKDWKFNVTQVQVLRPRLDINWPSIDFDDKPEESWKHEWEKHGTCGASLSAIRDEVHYFNVTLGLHEHFNLSLILQQTGISPSFDHGYKAKDILTALTKSIGVAPSITCVKARGGEKYYLEQVEICLSKEFKAINCEADQTPQVKDLLFKPESWLLGRKVDAGVLQDNIHDCGSEDSIVYYKPFTSRHSKPRA